MKQPTRIFVEPWSVLKACAVAFCLGFSGCGTVALQNPTLTKLRDRSVEISPRQTDRKSVHNTLGDPIIASRTWGVEVFRNASSQFGVVVVFMAPVGVERDEVSRYTLVAYDKNEVVEATASGILRRPRGTSYGIEPGNLSLRLQAGDFMFVREEEGDGMKTTLLVTPTRRDNYLEQTQRSSQATVVIGYRVGGYANKLQVDDGPVLTLPCRIWAQDIDTNAVAMLSQSTQTEQAKSYDTVAALRLSPGQHSLKAWGGVSQRGAGRLSGHQSISFSCQAGKVLYIVIDVSTKSASFWGAKGEWKIERFETMPELFVDRHLVLYRGGQWFVETQPTDR